MRGKPLGGAARDRIRLAPAFGERDDLGVERTGMLAGGDAGFMKQPSQSLGLKMGLGSVAISTPRLFCVAAVAVASCWARSSARSTCSADAAADQRQLSDARRRPSPSGWLVCSASFVRFASIDCDKAATVPFEAGSLGAHGAGGATETLRLGGAGAQGEQHQDADQGRGARTGRR